MFESKINRGRANGYAPLDSGSKVPLSYLPPIQTPFNTGSFATTSSLNTISESIDGRVGDLEVWSSSLGETFATDLEVSIVSSSVAATIGIVSQATGLLSTSSFNQYTASISTASLVDRLNIIESETGSFATTGSNTFIGNQTISGGLAIINNGYSWSFESNGRTKIPNITFNSDRGVGMVGIKPEIGREFQIETSTTASSVGPWSFGLDGTLTAPAGANIMRVGNLVTTSSFNSYTASVNNSVTSLNSYTSSLNNAFQLTGSNVSFLGNIVVYGTQSVINSQNVEISDNILYLSPTTSIDNDLGVVGHYNDGTYRHAGIFMDASDGHSWKVFKGLQTETTATVDTSGTGFTLADFKAGAFTGTSFNGQINSTNGVISGSSQLTSSFDTRYATSASYLTSLNGAISSSSQLTSSYDTRYTLSGSVQPLPNGLISGSSQLTSSYDTRYTLSGSVVNSNINTGSFATTGSNSFNGNQTITGSLVVSSVAVVSGGLTIPTGSVITLTSGSSIFVDSSGGITGSFSGSVFGIGNVTAFSSSVNSRINSITSSAIPAGTISGSSQLTSSFDTRYTLSGSVQPLPNGLISGSSQLTASYDTRYTLSGSVVSGTTPAGTISGSSQLTSSFDGRYTQTGSFNTLTASFNSFTASAQSVTTGSNSFNGTQTITGSLIITTGSFFASQITANTASLYLTSGSNMYVQNNGLVEITGSLTATSITGSIAATNGVISGSSQLISSFPLKTTGTWSVPNGASTQSFSVESGASYTMWVNGNIPNGIITWNATVTTSNANVPVVGSQYGWYYTAGNQLVLTSMPDQIIGTSNTIISSPTAYAPNTSNVFKFGITNNSGTTQTINYGYIKLS